MQYYFTHGKIETDDPAASGDGGIYIWALDRTSETGRQQFESGGVKEGTGLYFSLGRRPHMVGRAAGPLVGRIRFR